MILKFNDATISIHAPTRGATFLHDFLLQLHADFNPRSHKGSDNKYLPFWSFNLRFQSTLPQGERRNVNAAGYLVKNFNPRSHKGSDNNKWRATITVGGISIHAPTRGATVQNGGYEPCFSNFNPRSHKGSDTQIHIVVRIAVISIHAPTRGATVFCKNYSPQVLFQSTLPQGERRLPNPLKQRWFRDFNPRSHKGSDLWNMPGVSNRQISIHAPTRGATLMVLCSILQIIFQSTLPQGERQRQSICIRGR